MQTEKNNTTRTKQLESVISEETFSVFKSFKYMVSAQLHLLSIINSKTVSPVVKDKFRPILNRLNVNIRDFKLSVPSEFVPILEEQMINDEVALQIDAITDMLAEIPKGIRDEIESYIESRHKVYRLNR